MIDHRKQVFAAMCAMAMNWEGWEVFSIRHISEVCHLSKYTVTKAVHQLREIGLVENACVGRPAISYSDGGIEELWAEAQPPYHGFSITKKGMTMTEYKAAQKRYDEEMRKWAEGE